MIRPLLSGVLALVLSGCAVLSPLNRVQLQAQAQAPVASATANPVGVGAPPGSAEATIQTIVLQGNSEQERAISSQDSSVMRDTSTDSYYQDLVQTNQEMLDSGVIKIQLIKLNWGSVTLTGDAATVITDETWTSDYADGTTDESTDRNVYTLARESGLWKIQTDDHPSQAPPGPQSSSQPATPAPSASPTPGPRVPPAAISPAGVSRNWAGYVATGGTFTSVAANWVVPQPSADSSAGVDAAWVGIGGVRGQDLIQAGTQETVAGAGLIRRQSWVEILPQAAENVPLAVHGGDSVTVSLNQSQAGTWLIAFRNNTTGASYQTTRLYQSSFSSAEWVEEMPSGERSLLPLDSFGTITFSGGAAVKDGKTVNLAQADAQPVSMINGSRQPLASPSALTADGAGFSVTRTATKSSGFGRA